MQKKLLIVDDENDILEFVSYNFKKYDYEVYTASNAKEGIEKAILFIPDVIIADIRMLDVNGIEMCRRMKKNDILKNIPVVFLTADSNEYLALSAHYAGGADYINKPITIKLLLSIVEETLNRKSKN